MTSGGAPRWLINHGRSYSGVDITTIKGSVFSNFWLGGTTLRIRQTHHRSFTRGSLWVFPLGLLTFLWVLIIPNILDSIKPGWCTGNFRKSVAIWSILYYHIRTNQCTATANWSITHKPPFGYGSKVGTPRIRWLIPNIASESFAWRMWQIKNLPLTWRKTGVSFGWLHFAVSSVQRRATAPGSRHILTWQGGGPMMSSSLPWILASLCLVGNLTTGAFHFCFLMKQHQKHTCKTLLRLEEQERKMTRHAYNGRHCWYWSERKVSIGWA